MRDERERRLAIAVGLVGIGLVMAITAVIVFGRAGAPAEQAQGMTHRLAAALRIYDTEATQAQCLTNVKKITHAIQMYLTDYGKLPPDEHGEDAVAYFTSHDQGTTGCRNIANANPYLRWPVILDAYVKDRAAWACPSARITGGAGWIVPGPNWLDYERKNENAWGMMRPGVKKTDAVGGPCQQAWPSGWGGSVTDSIAQHTLAVPPGRGDKSTGAFRRDIGYPRAMEVAPSEVSDPAWFVVCGDASQAVISSPADIAYANVCRLGWMGTEGCEADWENCSWTQQCGVSKSEIEQFRTNPGVLRKYTRHVGGSNVGFMDGHATWLSAGRLIANAPGFGNPERGKLRGVGCGCLRRPIGK